MRENIHSLRSQCPCCRPKVVCGSNTHSRIPLLRPSNIPRLVFVRSQSRFGGVVASGVVRLVWRVTVLIRVIIVIVRIRRVRRGTVVRTRLVVVSHFFNKLSGNDQAKFSDGWSAEAKRMVVVAASAWYCGIQPQFGHLDLIDAPLTSASLWARLTT